MTKNHLFAVIFAILFVSCGRSSATDDSDNNNPKPPAGGNNNNNDGGKGSVECWHDDDCDDTWECDLDTNKCVPCFDPVCEIADDCDDNNSCTEDLCDVDHTCLYNFLPEGSDCNDKNPDTINDTCVAKGVCQGEEIEEPDCSDGCDDDNSCTTDTCHNGLCHHANVDDGAACDDGDSGTKNDQCSDGECVGVPVDCDADSDCQKLTTDCAVGVCENDTCVVVNVADGTACSGGTCDDGDCVEYQCAVDSQCSYLTTDCVVGVCESNTCVAQKVNGGVCDDGNPLTTDDHCDNGKCVGADPCESLDCDDHDPCTDDDCSNGSCVSEFNNAPCDDDNPNTVNDKCVTGKCKGTTVDCNDSNLCTDDSVVNGVCKNVFNTNPCNDNIAWTVNDTCHYGICEGIDKCQSMICNDGDVCTDDDCFQGACKHSSNTNPCNDGNSMTINDKCYDGACYGDEVLPKEVCFTPYNSPTGIIVEWEGDTNDTVSFYLDNNEERCIPTAIACSWYECSGGVCYNCAFAMNSSDYQHGESILLKNVYLVYGNGDTVPTTYIIDKTHYDWEDDDWPGGYVAEKVLVVLPKLDEIWKAFK
jgi:hypothetical protein